MPTQSISVPSRTGGLPLRRCRCSRCGAHTMTIVGQMIVEGNCSTCGSFELEPLSDQSPTGGGVSRERRFAREPAPAR